MFRYEIVSTSATTSPTGFTGGIIDKNLTPKGDIMQYFVVTNYNFGRSFNSGNQKIYF